MSNIEKALLDRDFPYLPPFFYRNELSLRCRLSLGSKRSALKRVREIFALLFNGAPDAIAFNYRIIDYSESGAPAAEQFGDPNDAVRIAGEYARFEAGRIRFLSHFQNTYRHEVVRDTLCALDAEDGLVLNNRIVCYSDGKGFDNGKLIKQCVDDRFDPDIGFVSFNNECFMAIYDDRGCDIVFADKAKFLEFYDKLSPYFLGYDGELMEKRRAEAEKSMTT